MTHEDTVYIVCDNPACGKAYPCGMSFPIESLKDPSNTIRNNKTTCPYCGTVNLWSKAELWPHSVAKQMFPNDVT